MGLRRGLGRNIEPRPTGRDGRGRMRGTYTRGRVGKVRPVSSRRVLSDPRVRGPHQSSPHPLEV